MSTGPEPSTPKNYNKKRSTLRFPVVGIGASAGGLKALMTFFENMPNECGMAFVVIMHLSPKHESNADKILQTVTKMPVLQVVEPTPIERNRVYVIPPAMDLSMNDGYLRLIKPERERGPQVAIDLFFRALADVHHNHSVGIVLSGTGSDGSVGLSRIKEQGGVTLAQTPEDAEYDSMPRSAIETDMVDIVLPVADMPQKLVELRHNLEILLKRQDPILSPGDSEQAGDARMPGIDGHQMMMAIRKNGLNTNTPSIALTGYGTLRDVEKAKAAGFTLHLRKPIDLQALIDAVTQAVR